MSDRQSNAWLDADQSEEEDDYGYDSEGAADSRGVVVHTRASKRRKLSESINNDDAEEEENVLILDEDASQNSSKTSRHASFVRQDLYVDASPSERQKDQNASHDESGSAPNPQKPSALTAKKLEAGRNRVKKTGVIYLTRVPPFMKPATVKHLLQPYGEVDRIFLTPEDPTTHARRMKAGGNKKRSFVDGWVEFQSKKDAKIAAETLNATIIGGKKGGWYHDDVWNMKYLKGFKWHHLTEQIANENAERAARLRAEIAQTTRENKAFLQNVERAKMLAGMDAKKNRKRKDLELETVEDDMDTSEPPTAGNASTFRRDIKQNEVKLKSVGADQKAAQSEDVKRVLSKIF